MVAANLNVRGEERPKIASEDNWKCSGWDAKLEEVSAEGEGGNREVGYGYLGNNYYWTAYHRKAKKGLNERPEKEGEANYP